MLQKRPTRWNRLGWNSLTRKPFRSLMEFVAGIHAAHGLAHGIAPSQPSAGRRP
jgi:hypothetical protein